MGLLTWFKKKEPEDFGQVLAALASDIQKRETQLNEIRLRERRATLLATLYTFAGWGAYLGLWYTQLLPSMSGQRHMNAAEKVIRDLPAVLGPVMYISLPFIFSVYVVDLVSRILFIRRIVQLWYNRKGNAEEKSLAALKLARRNKVEDFKKRTNYYETRELVERYEDGPSAGGTARSIDEPSSRLRSQQLQTTPQRTLPKVTPSTPANLRIPISPGLQNQLTQTPQEPLPPPRKLWYDKLADALLGEDESPVNAAASRYALICRKCFVHNGLVKEDMWEDAQYVCPKCGHFNPSARSQRKGYKSQQQTPTVQTPARSGPRVASPLNAPPPQSSTDPDGSPGSEGNTDVDL
ncbi:hypothetical protein F5148DRAFT_1327020 [Russula earlei]|uniref:Uncharacterized protein n=1 Tax=Russula earlei TaxID=71964 RepID=A0ACC0UIB0_9AGAM|nr:hypothetical protein F5148DRAFT_1327020 [Russula earlei]